MSDVTPSPSGQRDDASPGDAIVHTCNEPSELGCSPAPGCGAEPGQATALGAQAHLPSMAVVVATYNRANELSAMLESLAVAVGHMPHTQVWLIDNGSSDQTPTILAEWCARQQHAHWLRVTPPGKSRALNAAIERLDSEVVLFTDDDVVVDPLWIRATAEFFASHPKVAASAGRILVGEAAGGEMARNEIAADPKLWRLLVPIFDLGERECPVSTFYGANAAVRLSALRAVGMFDTRLGPGALGFYDDIELARRLRQAGFDLRYNPSAVVYHALPKSRFTERYLRERALALGFCATVAGLGPSLPRSCRAMVEASLQWFGALLLGQPNTRMRAAFRLARHWGSVRAHLSRARWAHQGPLRHP